MLPIQRRAAITELLSRDRAASIEHIAQSLDVSESTVRRDLDELERDGILKRVHGGAVLTRGQGPDAPEPSLPLRSVERARQKEAIAEATVELVQAGTTVLLTGGTTTGAVAHLLATVPGIVVVTNSLDIAHRLSGLDVDLIMLGGSLRRPELSLLGHLVPSGLRELHIDHVITGCYGIDSRSGLLGASGQECETDRHVARSAPRLTVLADGSKFAHRSPHRIVGVAAITELVTSSDAPVEDVEELRAQGVDVRVVDVTERPSTDNHRPMGSPRG